MIIAPAIVQPPAIVQQARNNRSLDISTALSGNMPRQHHHFAQVRPAMQVAVVAWNASLEHLLDPPDHLPYPFPRFHDSNIVSAGKPMHKPPRPNLLVIPGLQARITRPKLLRTVVSESLPWKMPVQYTIQS